jgi:hypothetical protein
VWGIADGTSIWDKNVTGVGPDKWDKSQHSFTEGAPPYLFDSGTVTTGTDHTSTGLTKTFVDNTKNWEPGRLVGFSVKIVNRNAEAYTLGSFITDNTSNSITYGFGRSEEQISLAGSRSYLLNWAAKSNSAAQIFRKLSGICGAFMRAPNAPGLGSPHN